MTDDGKVREVPFAEYARTRREVAAEIAAVNWLLAHFAEELPAESPTAMAIGRGAGWQEIEALARWEGAEEIAALLDEAGKNFGGALPPEATAVLDRSTEPSRLGTNPVPLPRRSGQRPGGGNDDEQSPGDEK